MLELQTDRHFKHGIEAGEVTRATELEQVSDAMKERKKDLMSFQSSRGRILFVDDEEDMAVSWQEALENLGYEVIAQSDPTAAFEIFKARPHGFDLVITDQTMPQIAGIDLAGKILTINPELPIILCTGYSEAVTSERAREIGIRALLRKPVNRNKMATVIRDVLDG